MKEPTSKIKHQQCYNQDQSVDVTISNNVMYRPPKKIMTTFTPSAATEMSRRRSSAPQEIFRKFRETNTSQQTDLPRSSTSTYTSLKNNAMTFKTMQDIKANLSSTFSSQTLPYRKSQLPSAPNVNPTKKRLSQRHSLALIKESEFQHNQCFMGAGGRNGEWYSADHHRDSMQNHRVPYYCNEVFCKNEQEQQGYFKSGKNI